MHRPVPKLSERHRCTADSPPFAARKRLRLPVARNTGFAPPRKLSELYGTAQPRRGQGFTAPPLWARVPRHYMMAAFRLISPPNSSSPSWFLSAFAACTFTPVIFSIPSYPNIPWLCPFCEILSENRQSTPDSLSSFSLF